MSYDPASGSGGVSLSTLRAYSYTGDGFTSVFLFGEALHAHEARLVVYRNGVRLRPIEDYVATTAGVTFVVPPAAQAAVIVTGWLISA